MGCDCDCHEKLNKIGVLGCCFKCAADHDTLRNALSSQRGFQIMSRKMLETAGADCWRKLMEAGKYERAGGDVVCPTCRQPFVEHPELPGFPTFHWICRGEIVKT